MPLAQLLARLLGQLGTRANAIGRRAKQALRNRRRRRGKRGRGAGGDTSAGSYTIKVVDKGKELKRLERTANNAHPVLRAFGKYLLKEHQTLHRTQGKSGGKQWAPRKVPSIAGILRDLMSGTNLDSSRFQGRPVLNVSGKLRQSYRARASARTLTIDNTAPYAGVHHEGGSQAISITDVMRRNASRLSDPTLRKRMMTITKSSQYAGRVRRRNLFVDPSDPEHQDALRKLFEAQVNGD